MGGATAPVAGSIRWPACTARVSNLMAARLARHPRKGKGPARGAGPCRGGPLWPPWCGERKQGAHAGAPLRQPPSVARVRGAALDGTLLAAGDDAVGLQGVGEVRDAAHESAVVAG